MAKRGSAQHRHAAVATARANRGEGQHAELRPALSQIDLRKGLALEIPSPMGGFQRLDVSEWLDFQNLWESLAELATRKLISLREGRSREQLIKQLDYGFLEFLREKQLLSFSLADMNAKVIKEFIAWINARRTSEGSPWARATKIHSLGAIRGIADLIPDLRKRRREVFPYDPFPAQEEDAGGTEPLDDDTSTALLKTALTGLDQLREVTKLVKETSRLFELGTSVRLDYKNDPIHCAAHLLQVYGGLLPERQQLMGEDDLDYRVKRAINKHGFRSIAKCWGPSALDLMPAIYAIGMQSALNEQTLRDLSIQRLEPREILGVRKLVLCVSKNRARSLERRSFELDSGEGTVAEILMLVKESTSLIRAAASPRLKDDLWLFVSRNKGAGGAVRSLHLRERETAFSNSQMVFLDGGGFEFIGFQKLRATASDLIQRESNGDLLLAKALLGHKDPRTTRGHYRGKTEQARGQERLASAMAQRERFLSSDGKSDHRGSICAEQKSSATPGFFCIDPYDSPISGQKAGVLCSAFGACPGCSLGTPVTDRPYALARMLQLKERLEEARDRMSPQEWIARWMNVLDRLSKWISAYASEDVLHQLTALDLEPIPEVE